MAEVTTVEYVKPQVKAITLKVTTSEARDMKTFIEEWYGKYYSTGTKYKSNSTYMALENALNGNVSSDQIAPF